MLCMNSLLVLWGRENITFVLLLIADFFSWHKFVAAQHLEMQAVATVATEAPVVVAQDPSSSSTTTGKEDPSVRSVRKVLVLFFASAKDAAGCSEVTLELPVEGCRVSDLTAILEVKFPGLAPILKQAMIAVDLEYNTDATTLLGPRVREVAVIPPVSGG